MRLKYAKKANSVDNIILLVRKDENLSTYPLTPKQIKFISSGLKKGKDSFVLSEYDKNIYIETCGIRSNGTILEKLRVSGAKLTTALNSSKAKEAILLSSISGVPVVLDSLLRKTDPSKQALHKTMLLTKLAERFDCASA